MNKSFYPGKSLWDKTGRKPDDDAELHLSSMLWENSDSQETHPNFVFQEMAYNKELPFPFGLELVNETLIYL